jgi:Rrf2 family transcriptional regulator, nitric oxide-sensitive transcriptional repressor
MRLTYFSDYAFRVLMYLAVTPDRRCTIREISEAYDISRAHLMKVVNLLTREGLVVAQRGPNGGLLLALPPERIRLGDVVRKTEDDLGIVECFRPENKCRLTPSCALAPALSRAMQAFLAELDKQTVADLVRKPQTIRRLLHAPDEALSGARQSELPQYPVRR